LTVKSIYIAGPMRGLPEWNFSAFDEATRKWRDSGWEAYSPHEFDMLLGYDARGKTETDLISKGSDRDWVRAVMVGDIACIMKVHAIALLPGWEGSMGATVELALAQFLGLEVYDAVTMEEISPDYRPWYEVKQYLETWQPKESSHPGLREHGSYKNVT
jgi:hypothetical protein